MFPDYVISKFFGLNTNVKDIKTLKPGYSPSSLNWITGGKEGDHIELRRGQALLGQTRNTDPGGKITGLGVGMRYDGVEIPFFSYGRKAKYYDSTTDDPIEIGTNLLPASADGEAVWFENYQGLAGSFVYLGSPNSGVYKVPVANPGNAVDQSVNNYRWGVFHVGQNRVFAGQRNGIVAGNRDKTGVYLSYIDKALLSSFTQVTGEAYGTGDGVTLTFAHTLSVISAPKTAMYVSVTDGVETFTDDRNGGMLGSAGGTGTVNYSTGAVSVTFAVAPTSPTAITCSYYHETSTSTGILDFSGSSNGQGKVFRQDDAGGVIQAIFNLNTIEYCFHELRTWQLTTSLDDTQSTNLPYRSIGIPSRKSAWQTPDGIIFADLARPNDPKFRRLQVLQGTTNQTIEPTPISDNLDLSSYGFSDCVVYRWGDYEIFCVQETVNGAVNTYNSVTYIRNVLSGAWDKLDYAVSTLREYNGTLIAGDSISNNVMTLFSGYDDDGEVINNYWTTTDMNLGSDHLKNCRRMVIDGLIQKEQGAVISVSYDGGAFTELKTIAGSGSYVDSSVNTYIGGPTLGSKVIGGGGSDTAHPFEIDFPINSDRFINVRLKVVATGVGYIAFNSFTFKDIRDKGRRNLPSRTI